MPWNQDQILCIQSCVNQLPWYSNLYCLCKCINYLIVVMVIFVPRYCTLISFGLNNVFII